MTNAPIDPGVVASGSGCVECLETGGWWLHLRRCAQCGHIGCCDNSPSQHATAHAQSSAHPVIRSFEPGEDWFWDYRSAQFTAGPPLAPPQHHPLDQPVPGPAGRVPRIGKTSCDDMGTSPTQCCSGADFSSVCRSPAGRATRRGFLFVRLFRAS